MTEKRKALAEWVKVTAYDTTLTVYGKTRTVQILEVDSPVLTYDHSGVTWPAYLPRLDGALLW